MGGGGFGIWPLGCSGWNRKKTRKESEWTFHGNWSSWHSDKVWHQTLNVLITVGLIVIQNKCLLLIGSFFSHMFVCFCFVFFCQVNLLFVWFSNVVTCAWKTIMSALRHLLAKTWNSRTPGMKSANVCLYPMKTLDFRFWPCDMKTFGLDREQRENGWKRNH